MEKALAEAREAKNLRSEKETLQNDLRQARMFIFSFSFSFL